MTHHLAPTRLICLLAVLLTLAACEDSEDRAARHLENAEALVAEGDLGAAVLEFRNALEFAPNNREALTQLADIQMANGAEGAAVGTYQRLVDNHPDATEGWLNLAEIAIRQNRWDEAATFADQAETQAPDSPRTALIRAALDFRTAVETQDADAAGAAAAVARRHVADDPANLIARQILIAHAGNFLTPEDALAELDAALAVLPDNYILHQLKVQTLADLGRTDAVGPALETMAQQFPDNTEPRQLLVNWYLGQGDTEAVERFLRMRAEADTAEFSDRLSLVNFLRELRGPEPALAEIDRQIAALPDDASTEDAARDLAVLRGLRATLVFDTGDPEAAIAELEGVLGTLPDGAEANNLRVALARMLSTVGREDDARAAVEAVLAQDSGHVDASKIKAQWLIAEDQTDAAVQLLRQAQATAPRDAEVVRLMGDAHARAGSWELAGERYATAVDLSGRAPRDSLIYANFLIGQERPGPAETVLVDALRQTPNNPDLLAALTGLHLQEGRPDQARQGIAQLRALDTDAARRAAASLEADLLLRANRTADTQVLIEQMAAEGQGDAQRLAALIEAQISEGNIEDAKAMLARQLETYPDDPLLRFLRGGIHMVEGEIAVAETTYRDILADYPAAAPPLRVLYGILRQQGRDDEAQALLQETRAAAPDAMLPRLLLAEQAQRDGDMDGAIALYEDIYADDSSNLVVANNLANLLMARPDDAAALDRAHAITRRLRGTEEPAFQDTYGWIAYLREDYDTALEYLSAAAEALPEEPTVQYHLGMTYLALERPEEARAALERTIDLAGDRPLPEADRARDALQGL
jgi:tetratricopeptide (TPR) repeat protein